MALSRVLARRVGMLRGLATATFSKPGPPSQVVVLGNDVAVKSLGDNEVSLRFLAAPVTSTDLKTIEGKLATPSLPAVPGSEGVGVVTAVGSKVTGLAPDDWVVPTIPTLGKCRSNRSHTERYDCLAICAKALLLLPVEENVIGLDSRGRSDIWHIVHGERRACIIMLWAGHS